jgi:hypothetical protein
MLRLPAAAALVITSWLFAVKINLASSLKPEKSPRVMSAKRWLSALWSP